MKKKIYILSAAFLSLAMTQANAQTWRPKGRGLPSGFAAKSVYGEGSLMMAANVSAFSGSQMYYTPDTLTPFAGSPSSLGSFSAMETGVVKCRGIHFAGSIGGVYKSHDNGQHWTSVGASGSTACYALYGHGDTLYASFGAGLGIPNISVDTGVTWTPVTGYSGSLATAYLKYNGVLYIGSTGGLKYTADGGATWNTVSTPTTLGGQTIVGIAELGGNVYAACSNGVFKSADNGATWANVLAQSMFCLTTIDTSLFGGTNMYGVYQSDRSGTNWTQLVNGLPPSGGVHQTVNYISSNDYFVIASAQGDSAVYVIGLSELGLHAPGTTTSINTTGQGKMSATVFPNPARKDVTIRFENVTTEKKIITISDVAGRNIKTVDCLNSSAVIDVSDFAEGIYFIHLISGNEQLVKKLVIVN